MEHIKPILAAAAIAVGVRLGTAAGTALAVYGLNADHVATVAALVAPVIGLGFDAFIGALVKRKAA